MDRGKGVAIAAAVAVARAVTQETEVGVLRLVLPPLAVLGLEAVLAVVVILSLRTGVVVAAVVSVFWVKVLQELALVLLPVALEEAVAQTERREQWQQVEDCTEVEAAVLLQAVRVPIIRGMEHAVLLALSGARAELSHQP